MAVILKDLYVECYRGINGLKLEEFNHVNVLVGDNNVGKTSVMEMICALSSPLSTSVWNEIAIKKTDSYKRARFYSGYQYIFPMACDKKVVFSGEFSIYGKKTVNMYAEEYKDMISEREIDRINGYIKTGNPKVEDSFMETNAMDVYIEADYGNIRFTVYDFQRRPPRVPFRKADKMEFDIGTVFIEPRDGLENDSVYLQQAIIDTEYYEQLVDILKEFDETITAIVAVEEKGSIVYYVRTDAYSTAVPVSIYGDGIKKALIIFSALVANKGGIVLIDEIETSIHTSAMKKVFLSLIQWARHLNVQLFLSTHSKEALDIMLNLNKDMCEGINVYTLYRHDSRNYVRRLSCEEALDLQQKMGMEIR